MIKTFIVFAFMMGVDLFSIVFLVVLFWIPWFFLLRRRYRKILSDRAAQVVPRALVVGFLLAGLSVVLLFAVLTAILMILEG